MTASASPRSDIWITVFAGDDELGLGPDQEAIDAWLEIGVPRERIVECPREENFWQAGPTGPCGPCSELYLDRGIEHGKADDLPGGDNERFMEYWNLVFMELDQNPVGVLTPLPAKNIDTGMGLNRMACILQDKATVFETDQFAPLIELGEELSGRRYGVEFPIDRALRVLADHSRAMTFLIADGVVPSNEDRGYVLRRIMRRAIQHGRGLGLEPGYLHRYAERVTELMGSAVSRAVRAARPRAALAGRRGGELRPHARAGPGAARRADRARARRRCRGDLRRRRLPAARHVRVSDRPHAGDRRRARARGRRGRLRVADGGPAHPGARRLRVAAASTRVCATAPLALAGGPGFETEFVGYETPMRRPRSARRSATTAACWSSWSSRRSTRPAAARWRTRA